MFSVRDAKAEAYLQPFFAPTIAVALRLIESAANNGDHDFHIHSEDYHLYHLGCFDEQSGYFAPIDPVCISKIIDLVRTTPPTVESILPLLNEA